MSLFLRGPQGGPDCKSCLSQLSHESSSLCRLRDAPGDDVVPPSRKGSNLSCTNYAKYFSSNFHSDSQAKYYHSHFTDDRPKAQEK